MFLKNRVAFRFVEELLGDVAHVAINSSSPNVLIFDDAVRTITTAAECYVAIIEHYNTKAKKATSDELRLKYEKLAQQKKQNLVEIEIEKIKLEYETNRGLISENQMKTKTVIRFSNQMLKNLNRMISDYEEIESETDFSKRDIVEENLRKALRDYNNIIRLIS